MDFELIAGVAVVPLIVVIIQIVKSLFHLDSKWAPVIAIALGLAASFGYTYYGESKAFEALVIGLAAGLSAVGLYSGSKNTLGRLRK